MLKENRVTEIGGQKFVDTQRNTAAKSSSLYVICRDALTKHKDKDEATESAIAYIKGNKKVYASVVNKLIEKAVKQAIRLAMNESRRDMLQTSLQTSPRRGDPAAALKRMAARNFFEYRLVGGHFIGDATKHELTASINFYEWQSDSYSKKAAWLSSVKKLIGNKLVREALTEEKIGKLAQDAGFNPLEEEEEEDDD